MAGQNDPPHDNGKAWETAMKAFDFDLSLVNPNQSPEVQRAAVGSLLDKFFLSHILILPTPGPDRDETQKLFDDALGRLHNASGVLERFLRGNADPEAEANALETKNFIDVFIEAAQELGNETAEGGGGDDTQDTPGTRAAQAELVVDDGVAVRGPFVFFPRHGHCHERSFALEIECGGCGVVVKEFRGLQLRRRRIVITRVIEPWSSRRRIVRRIVWVLEWVPVQMIKTISVRCCGDHTKTHIEKQVVLDRELMTFWRCF